MNVDLNNVGPVFASERIGRTVTFWCRSLNGGETDSVLIRLTFANESIAHAVQMESAWVGAES